MKRSGEEKQFTVDREGVVAGTGQAGGGDRDSDRGRQSRGDEAPAVANGLKDYGVGCGRHGRRPRQRTNGRHNGQQLLQHAQTRTHGPAEWGKRQLTGTHELLDIRRPRATRPRLERGRPIRRVAAAAETKQRLIQNDARAGTPRDINDTATTEAQEQTHGRRSQKGSVEDRETENGGRARESRRISSRSRITRQGDQP